MNSIRKRYESRLRNRAPQEPTELPDEVKNFMQIYSKPSYYWQKVLIKLWSCESRFMEVKAVEYGNVYYLTWAFANLGHDGIYWRWFYTEDGLNAYARQIIQTFNDILTLDEKEVKEIIERYKTYPFSDKQ